MKTHESKLRTALLGTLGAAILSGGVIAQEPTMVIKPEPTEIHSVATPEVPIVEKTPKVTFGFNGLETAVTDEGTLFNRAYTNIDFNVGDVKFTYHGLNQVEDLGIGNNRMDSYFGAHDIGIAPKDGLTELVFNFNTDSQGTTDSSGMLGIRDYSLAKNFADYGWIKATTNAEDLNVTSFLGWELSDKLGMEFFQSTDLNLSTGDLSNYAEITPIKVELGDNTDLIFRVDTTDFDFGNDATYLLGISTTF